MSFVSLAIAAFSFPTLLSGAAVTRVVCLETLERAFPTSHEDCRRRNWIGPEGENGRTSLSLDAASLSKAFFLSLFSHCKVANPLASSQ